MNLSKKSKKIFNNIENVRKKNNKNWMDLLRLSYVSNPKITIQILTKILRKDGELIKLANQLKKITK
tara:strand:+ start:80 stop:280 length:201 start_codon:yes stop_codon:yes gene_type:complete